MEIFRTCAITGVLLLLSATAQAEAETVMTKRMTFEACLATEKEVIASVGVPANRIIPIVNTGIMRMTKIVTDDGNVIITCSKLDQKMVVTQSKPPDLHLVDR